MSEVELMTLEAQDREKIGKNNNRRLRRAGMIPANIIGKGKNRSVSLDPKWLSKIWQSGKKFNLSLDGDVKPVKIQELQINAVKRSAVHVDLMYL